MKRLGVIVLLGAVGISGAAHAVNLIQNGSFEVSTPAFSGTYVTYNAGQTSLSGWSIDTGSIDYINTYWQPAQGSYSVDLWGNGHGEISQSFATTPNQTYVVSFQYSVNPDNGSASRGVAVAAPGASQNFTFTNTPNSLGNMKWQTGTFMFTATDASTTLSFGAFDAGNPSQCCWGAALDNVSVTPVPEPQEWAMMVAGLGLVGTIAARRRGRGTAL